MIPPPEDNLMAMEEVRLYCHRLPILTIGYTMGFIPMAQKFPLMETADD